MIQSKGMHEFMDIHNMSDREIISEMDIVLTSTTNAENKTDYLEDRAERSAQYERYAIELSNRDEVKFNKKTIPLWVKEYGITRRIDLLRHDRTVFENKYVATNDEININIAQDITCDILMYLDEVKNVKSELKKLGVGNIDY